MKHEQEEKKNRKVLYVATVVKTHIMEFHIPYLKMLKEMGWETAVAARNDYDNPEECVIPYCDHYYNILFSRNPFNPMNFRAYKQLRQLINGGEFDIIHCHTPVGGLLTRLAAKKARRRGSKIFYTAHGFHFYKGASLKNWIMYYPVEKWLARKTDVLITINGEDYNRAKAFKAQKIVFVPGVGIDINRFAKPQTSRDAKRKELGIADDDFMVLSVGELIKRKNHSVVIEALQQLHQNGTIDRIQYVICGRGVLEEELKKKAISQGVSGHIKFLGYRNDVNDICNASDLFVFMSFQEGLPVALMEALSCELPVICSNIRGNTDLVTNGDNGMIIENNSQAVADAILKMKNNRSLRDSYAKKARSSLVKYEIDSVLKRMKDLYLEAVDYDHTMKVLKEGQKE